MEGTSSNWQWASFCPAGLLPRWDLTQVKQLSPPIKNHRQSHTFLIKLWIWEHFHSFIVLLEIYVVLLCGWFFELSRELLCLSFFTLLVDSPRACYYSTTNQLPCYCYCFWVNYWLVSQVQPWPVRACIALHVFRSSLAYVYSFPSLHWFKVLADTTNTNRKLWGMSTSWTLVRGL